MTLLCIVTPLKLCEMNVFTDPKVVVEYGGGTVPILFEGLSCTGTEDSLLECNHNGIHGSHNCFDFEHIGVSCGKLRTFVDCSYFPTLCLDSVLSMYIPLFRQPHRALKVK